MKRGPGRPKLPEGTAKGSLMNLRVTPDEREAYERAAEAAGVGFSEWARAALMDAAEAQYIIPKLADAIRDLHGGEPTFAEVVHVGNESVATGGDVYVFDLAGNALAPRAYAWSLPVDGGKRRRFVAVLHAGPVTGPAGAIKALAEAEQQARERTN